MLKEFELIKKISLSEFCPHAYLFTGATGVGKFETAIKFAKFLNCENQSNFSDDCDCDQCKMINKNIHPDVYIVEKQEGKKEIVDSQIIDKDKKEGIIYKINNNPLSGKYNIVIIRDADSMNKTVSNTILKNLEEPKTDTIFILTTTNKKNILETIISRCCVIDFNLLNKDEVAKLTNNNDIDLVCDLSSYKYKKVLELNNKEVLDEYINDIKEFCNVIKSSDTDKILYIGKVLEDKTKLWYYVYIWELVFNFYISQKHHEFLGDITIENIGEVMKSVYDLKEAITGNYILEIKLNNFLLSIRVK